MEWTTFYSDKWNLTCLRTLLYKTQHDKLFLIPIKLQINSVVLLLCINRNVPYLPKEIYEIIRENTQYHIHHFKPKKYAIHGYYRTGLFVPKISLGSQFEHIKNNNVEKLQSYLKIGTIGRYRKRFIGHIYYIITDINYEYYTVSIIEICTGSPRSMKNIGYVTMFTFDDFVRLGDEYVMENYISNTIIELEYSIKNVV